MPTVGLRGGLLSTLLGIAALGLGGSPVNAQSANPDLTKTPSLYLVGYSHLDTEWCWNYPQVIREFIPNTLHENFALFEKYPRYLFNWTGSNRYRFMKEYYPDDYAKLKQYIAKGRWYPNGSSVEEGDVNNPSPESLIRQVMYGNQFFRHEFGVAGNDYMLPDCFGFPASLPSLLAHAGVSGFSTQKLTWGSAVGIPFNVGVWEGPDGQGVLAALNAEAYDSPLRGDMSHNNRWIQRIKANGDKSGVFADFHYYGVGDRGGAPGADSVDWLEKSLQGGGPLNIISARADQLFSAISPQEATGLPRYKGDLELTQHSAGSLTSESAIKHWNRRNEVLADAAEKASVGAMLLQTQSYPHERLTDAWLRFLPAQFHDIMAGTALPESYNFSWNDEILALNEFADVLQQSVGGIARGLDTRTQHPDEIALTVYNALSVAREDVVEASISLPGNSTSHSVDVIGPDNQPVLSQIVGRDPDGKTRFLFIAKTPPVGMTVYRVRTAAHAPRALGKFDAPLISSRILENARWRVRLNENGDVASIYDKAAKKELLSAPARLAFQHENPTQFPAWNMDWNDQMQPPRAYVDGPPTIRVVENGPVRVALQIEREAQGSRFVQTIRLSAVANSPVEFANTIDWKSRDCALKAEFPLTVSNGQATYNWGVGTIQRGNNDPRKYEVASHQWFDLASPDNRYGVTILTDDKHGSDKPGDNLLRLTLLYTPGVRGGYQHQATQDWGRHEIVYGIYGHIGDWRTGDSQTQATRLNQPLLAFQVPAHAGPLGKSFSLAQISVPHQVQIMALKKAEESDEVIVRLNELTGRSATGVRLSLAAPIVSAREVDGQERPWKGKAGGAVRVQNGALVCDMGGYRPRAFALRLGKLATRLTPPAIAQPLSLPLNRTVTRRRDGSGGGFDAKGRALPAELLPNRIESGDIPFNLATKEGAPNALACQGQSLTLPAAPKGGSGPRRLYLLAASSNGDTNATFRVNMTRPVTLRVQNWGGFVGQWDNREWEGKVPQLTYGWDNALDALTPGYTRRAPVAWYSDHWRLSDGQNDPYRFCYLYRYAIDLPSGAQTVTLPNNPHVHVLAATVAADANEIAAIPAQPLYDTLADHAHNNAPTIIPPANKGALADAALVSLQSPLYGKADGSDLHYTLDGSLPNAQSPAYHGPFFVTRTSTVRARQIGGATSSVASTRIAITDTTPPRLTSASVTGLSEMQVVFSEPVTRATAENVAHYKLDAPGATVASAHLAPDNRTAVLETSSSLPREGAIHLIVSGVRDTSERGNEAAQATREVALLKPVWSQAEPVTFNGKGAGQTFRRVAGLPTKGSAPWTINLFVSLDDEPDELTLLGGFGSGNDTSGEQRYLIKFHGGLHFWGSNVDIPTGKPLALGRWQMVTATYDGKMVRLYADGKELAARPASLRDAAPSVRFGVPGPWDNRGHQLEGKIANFTIWDRALPPDVLPLLIASGPKSTGSAVPDAAPNAAPAPVVDASQLDDAEKVKGQLTDTELANAKGFAATTPGLITKGWPLIVRTLGIEDLPAPRRIKVVYDFGYKGVAATGGTTISVAPGWVGKHPDDEGMIIHEMTHVAQSYPRYDPVWLVEGIADYVRWIVYEPESARPHPNPERATARDSYRTTAAFLDWASRKYDPALVKKLDHALRADTYKEEMFKQLTGKSLDELNTEWIAALRVERAAKAAK